MIESEESEINLERRSGPVTTFIIGSSIQLTKKQTTFFMLTKLNGRKTVNQIWERPCFA